MKEEEKHTDEIPYPNTYWLLLIAVVSTLWVIWPTSTQLWAYLIQQRWFYFSMSVSFCISLAVVNIVDFATRCLDKTRPWDNGFKKRVMFQIVLGWVGPIIFTFLLSWLFFSIMQADARAISYSKYLFRIVALIALVLNLSYGACYFAYSHFKSLNEEVAEPTHFEDGFYYFITSNKSEIQLTIQEIAYIYIESNVIFLMMYDGRTHILMETLEVLEKRLNSAYFFRVNRSYIVTRNSVSRRESHDNRRIKLTLNPPTNIPVIVSRKKVQYFEAWLKA
jgi:DNA-binding LytR/AlgR family response regulator